jgi:hypothetical protein
MAPYCPPANTNYAEVPVPEHVNIRTVMKSMYFFTEKSGCHYLWTDVRRRVVEIWGREDFIPGAIRMIRRKIVKLEKGRVSVYGAAKLVTWKLDGYVYYRLSGDNKDMLELANMLFADFLSEGNRMHIAELAANNVLIKHLDL